MNAEIVKIPLFKPYSTEVERCEWCRHKIFGSYIRIKTLEKSTLYFCCIRCLRLYANSKGEVE